MPFDVKGLNRLSHLGTANADPSPSKWLYVTTDTHANIIAAGYFNAQAQFMRKGDVIEAVSSLGGTPVVRMYVVTATTSTTVTITAVTGASWT
jgi:dihydroxyacetone kinase